MRIARLRAVVVLILLASTLLAARLVQVQVFLGDDLRERVTRQHSSMVRLTPRRGAIVDRTGRPLALSVVGASVGLRPQAIPAEQREDVAHAVAGATGQSAWRLRRKLATRERFFFAATQADARTGEALGGLELPGIEVQDDWRRVYPHARLAAHVLGFVGTEGGGMCGLEQRYDDRLSGPERRVVVLHDALRQPFRERGADEAPPPTLELTLLASLQAEVERLLAEGVRDARAKAGVAVVMDVDSGEILAMASHPTFDLMDRRVRSPGTSWNRAVGMTFEPGSVMKTITVAAALEAGKLRTTEIFDVGDGVLPLPGGALREHDRTVRGRLDVPAILSQSSNVGAALIAMRLEPDELYSAFRAFGMGLPSGVDLPGGEAGVLRPPSGWTDRSPAMLAIGQEMSTTPVGMLAAYAALAADGRRPTPRVGRAWIEPDGTRTPIEVPAPVRVLSEATARTMVGLLQRVVEEGTGRSARVPGYRVAGKTGTAQKAGPGGYQPDLYVSSFVGFGPVADPRIAVAVVIDEPTNGYYASDVASPVWSRIMAETFRTLRIPANELLVARPPSVPAVAEPAALERRPVAASAAPGVSRGSGRVPDLVGLGLREALVALTSEGYRAEVAGSGLVVAQSPAAGTPGEKGMVCRLTLGKSS